MKRVDAEEFDRMLDAGENVGDYLDWSSARRPGGGAPARDDSPRQVSMTLPARLVDFMDDKAVRRCVSRKTIANDWLVDRADQEIARRKATT